MTQTAMTQIWQRRSVKFCGFFMTFPPKDSLGLFPGHIQETKSVEFAFVAIYVRSFHKMPVLRVVECYSEIGKGQR